MTFKNDEIQNFFDIFENSKNKIRYFEGCNYLELLQTKNNINEIWTLSIWDSEQHLNKYRNSELFKNTWQATKLLFKDKPKAFTLNSLKKSI